MTDGATESSRPEDLASGQDRSPKRRRRVIRAGIAVVVLLIGGSLALWFFWLPHFRPSLKAGERYGIDVSSHQGHITWSAVPRDHMHFAYIKATEGGDFVDPRFHENWSGAVAAGLDRGAYHFFTLCAPGETSSSKSLGVIESPRRIADK